MVLFDGILFAPAPLTFTVDGCGVDYGDGWRWRCIAMTTTRQHDLSSINSQLYVERTVQLNLPSHIELPLDRRPTRRWHRRYRYRNGTANGEFDVLGCVVLVWCAVRGGA